MTLPSPYFALRAADDRCTGMRVRFGAACTVERIELSGAEDNDRAKDVMAEWATSFRRIFTYFVPHSLVIWIRQGDIPPEAPDEAAPEAVFRAYESGFFEDALEFFDGSNAQAFTKIVDFCRRPGQLSDTPHFAAARALRSWFRGVKTFWLRLDVFRPTAHQRLELARRIRRP